MSGTNIDEMILSSVVLDDEEMRRAWTRVAHQVLERNHGVENLVLIGILRKGGPLADRLRTSIQRIEGIDIPSGILDISLYRDDFRTYQPRVGTTNIPFDIEGKKVVLVDDVLSTGRTVRAALGALNDLGRPSIIQLAVLVDRGHRELPIRPDFVGKNVPSSNNEFVRVSLTEFDGKDVVEIYRER
jgi:pyrimidine operon attenuation protein / uracil phosphoribosyltransferase